MAMSSASSADDGAVLPSGVRPLDLLDPSEIGGHRLVGRLGEGGMGVVFLGRDGQGALVAVKAAHEDADEIARRRFTAEAASARRVPVPYTARLLVDGTDHEPPYIITEYVEGRSLEDVVEKDGPLPPEQLRALATGVARALAAIHRSGLVHRDLKPANVLLTPTGPRVIDFGIAQEIPAAGGVTGDGVVVGSPGWIAPERLTRHPATPSSDVFGWGSLITYAGTGRNPFGEGDSDQVALRTIHDPPDLEGLEPFVRRLVAVTLSKDPDDRPSAGALLALLSPADPLAELAVLESRAAVRPARRRRVKVLAAGSAVAVAVTLTATVANDTNRTVRRPPGDGTAATPPPLAVGERGGQPTPQPRQGSPAHQAGAPQPAAPGVRQHAPTAPRSARDAGHGTSDTIPGRVTGAVARATSGHTTGQTIDGLLNPSG